MPRRPMNAAHAGWLMQELSLGSIMAVIPKERVAEALRETGTESVRNRLLPAAMVSYLVVMLALYAEVSVRENLRIVLEPLRRKFGLGRTKMPVDSAITKARKRLGAEPFEWLFNRIARPMGEKSLKGCFWRDLRVVAADATTVAVQDTEENRLRFGIHTNQHGRAGYPQVKIAVLAECGTRAPLSLAFGRGDDYEPALWDLLRDKLTKEMLFLADRGYYSFERWKDCSRRCGALLWRVNRSLILRPIRRFADGSYLAKIRPSDKLVRKGLSRRDESMIVRVIEYEPIFADGSRGERARLITTPSDPADASAEELGRLYTQRWTIETGFDELKTHLKGPGRVLRSQLPELVEQEIYGFFLAYYVVRATLADAAKREGCSPGELSFVHAVRVIKRRLSFPPSQERDHEADI